MKRCVDANLDASDYVIWGKEPSSMLLTHDKNTPNAF